MSTVPQQLILDLKPRPALGEEDFFPARSNLLALRLIDAWPDWAEYGQILSGPAASGKSHLMNVWRMRSNAALILAPQLDKHRLENLPDKAPCVAVEDIDRDLASEDALFHLLNIVRERRGSVLLTMRDRPDMERFQLKDLRSRLQALPVVAIDAPDDDLLRAVMLKQFSDRQIEIEPQLIEYLLKRIERSMESVSRMVEALDKGSLGTGRRMTKPLARQILSDLARDDG